MNKTKLLLCGCVSGVLVLTLAGIVWFHVLRHGPPHGLIKDIRAGIAARHIKDPDERLLKYLEGRYGAMSEPANRERVFWTSLM